MRPMRTFVHEIDQRIHHSFECRPVWEVQTSVPTVYDAKEQ